MYKRKEVTEEEHLDWDSKTRDTTQDKMVNISRPAEQKPKQIILNEESNVEENPHIQSSVLTFFDEHEYSVILPMILIVPYLVGLLFNFILFYTYSGITLGKVFSIEKQHNIIELWSIGAYLFITLGTIWILLKMFKEAR